MTSPDMDSRIEAASAAAWEVNCRIFSEAYPDAEPIPSWVDELEGLRASWRAMLAAAIPAAFPELLADPPSAWLAPWEASHEMTAAAMESGAFDNGVFQPHRAMADGAWEAMRDAHLNLPPKDEEDGHHDHTLRAGMDEDKANAALTFLEAKADEWMADSMIVNMIKNIVHASRLDASAPKEEREKFIARQEELIDALVRLTFVEASYRGCIGAYDSIRIGYDPKPPKDEDQA